MKKFKIERREITYVVGDNFDVATKNLTGEITLIEESDYTLSDGVRYVLLDAGFKEEHLFDEFSKNLELLISYMTDEIIKPLELEKYALKQFKNFGSPRESIILTKSLNMYKELMNFDKSDYTIDIINTVIDLIKETKSYEEVKALFIEEVLITYFGEISAFLVEYSRDLFKKEIEVDSEFFYKTVSETFNDYLAKKIKINSYEDFKEIIESQIIDNYFDSLFNGTYDYYRERILEMDYYLNLINYSEITEKIYSNCNFNIDRVDDLVNEIFEGNTSYVVNLDKFDINFDIFPKQGDNSAIDLRNYLKQLAIKLNLKPSVPIHQHHKIPACIKSLLKSQGYNHNDLFNNEKISSSKFLKSFIEEVKGKPDGETLLGFMLKTDLEGLYNLMKFNKFSIDKSTYCGFVSLQSEDIGNFDLKLEKDIELSFSVFNESIYLEGYRPSGSGITDIWDISSNDYKRISFK